MPFVSRKPPLKNAVQLAAFVQEAIKSKRVSLRFAAREMKVSPAQLSLIMNGERIPDAGVCNAIADFCGVPRVQVYGLAGWLELEDQDDEALTNLLNPLVSSEEQLSRLKWIYYSIGHQTARVDLQVWVLQCEFGKTATDQPSGSNE